MKNIQITARFTVHNGKLDEFKRIADNCISVTKEKDQNTLQYDWFFSQDEMECVVRENYSDSNAVMSHMGNLGDLLGKILEVSDVDLEVFGNPSEELANAAAAFKPKVYSFYKSM